MYTRIFFALFCAFCMIFPCSCSSQKDTLQTKSSTKSEIKDEYFLIENNEKNTICISLEKNENYNKNHYDFIENFIELKFEKICGETFNLIQSKTSVNGEKESYSNYYSDIVAKTVFYSNNITSITFEGILNKKSAAHPMHIFFTLNFNPKTIKEIEFCDLFIADDKLYSDFCKEAEKELIEECGGKWPETWGKFSETFCTKNSFLTALKSDKKDLAEIYWHLADNGIVFSYPVEYALGGHKEVRLEKTSIKSISTSIRGRFSD